MKIGRRVIFWITAFALVFVTFWFGYIHQPPKEQEPQKPVPVEVQDVGTASIEDKIELTGWIEASKLVHVKSKVAGRIESLQAVTDGGDLVAVEEGLTVKKGQQLAVIDHDLYLAQVASAQAAVKAAEVQLADAEREKKRILALYEAGSATEQSKDKAITAAEMADANLRSAQATLDLAEINLRESKIISPIDGIVTKKYVDQGNLIRPGDPIVGDRIVTVADMTTVKVIVAVAERHAGKIAVGTPVRLRVDPYPERVFTASVYSVYPALDEQTHTIQVEVRLKNDEMLLKPGMFARVTLITQRRENVVVIPRDVVLGGKIDPHYVYVVQDGIGRKRLVKLGITQAARCEITDGLQVDERLVVNGMNYLTDGISVEVVRMEDIR